MIFVETSDPAVIERGPVKIVKINVDPTPLNEQYIFSYLITDGERNVLIDVGPAGGFERLTKALEEMGVEKLDAVFLTHIHLDHAGAVGHLVEKYDAVVYVHPKGSKHLADPSKLNEAAKQALGEEVFQLYKPMKPVSPEKIRETDDGAVYEIGNIRVKAVFTPGHAPHHQALLVEDVLFPGDALGELTPWIGAYTPTTPHRTIIPMIVDSIMKLMMLDVNSVAFTHRGVIDSRREALAQMHGEIEQIRTWEQVIAIRMKECGEDVWCYYDKLLRADPLLRKLHETGEMDKSRLLKNSVRMSIYGTYKYCQSTFT